MTERQEMEAAIEAILFAATEPVVEKKMLEVFDEKDREEAAAALATVIATYREQPERGVMIDEVAGGLRLVTRPDLYSYLRRFFEVSGTNKLTMAALETLAIVAYRQPVTGPEIQELRGVNVSGVLKTLLERRLIRISGRKEVVGKPFLYATTREFLQHFGLRNLKELPPLEQFEEFLGVESEAATETGGADYEEEVLREVAALEDEETEEGEENEKGEENEEDRPEDGSQVEAAASEDDVANIETGEEETNTEAEESVDVEASLAFPSTVTEQEDEAELPPGPADDMDSEKGATAGQAETVADEPATDGEEQEPPMVEAGTDDPQPAGEDSAREVLN